MLLSNEVNIGAGVSEKGEPKTMFDITIVLIRHELTYKICLALFAVVI